MATLMSFTVGTNDFRRALLAVSPSVSRDEKLPMICRLRCYIDRENVTVAATDRFTAALGLVSVWDRGFFSSDGAIDLGMPDVAKILAVFSGGKDDGDAPQWRLRIELLEKRSVTDTETPSEVSSLTVRITDASGMIDGEVLDLPALTPHENFPDLPQLFANNLAKPTGLLDLFGVRGELLSRLKTAANVYGKHEPLVLSTPGSERAPIIVRCGESFLGMVMPVYMSEDMQMGVKSVQEAWMRRLPAPSATRTVELDMIRDSYESEPESADRLRRAATEMVITAQFGSASMLHRRLGIGYGRACTVLDELEAAGIVGPAKGSMARTVLFTPSELLKAMTQLDTAQERNDADDD